MVRTENNELCISIPSYFKCPISLELMKSPVSLSTGITYDRTSIQTWLDGGNTTCPATMQSLSSPSFVPNLTLHRLIHLWSTSHSVSPPLLRRFEIDGSDDLTPSLKNILDRAAKSEVDRGVLVSSVSFLDSIVELIVKCDEIVNLELIFLILDLCNGEKVQKLLMNYNDCFEKFVAVLRNGSSDEAKIAVASIIKKIAIDKQMKTPLLIVDLYNMVKSRSNPSIKAGLSALIAISTSKASKIELLRLGMVKRVAEILCSTERTTDMVLIEKSMEMIEVMATCTEGRAAICEEERCVVEIVRKLMKVSEKATEHGVTVVWSLCYLIRDEKMKKIMWESNGLEKCLLLLQSNCSQIVKQMCGDLVKVLRVNYKSCLGVYHTRTTHIMPY